MTPELTFNFFKTLEQDRLSLIYQGHFTDEITTKVIDLSEQNIEKLAMGKIKRRVSFLLAECFQNIVRHGENPAHINRVTDKTGMFFTRNIGRTFYIISANLIEKEKVPELKEKLKKVNELDQDGLKSLYVAVLSTEGMSDKGGAGLGLIEMARKSGQKLEYAFEAVNDKLVYFYLQVKFKGKPGEEEETEEPDLQLQDAVDCHRDMGDANILLIQKGDYTQKSILPVMKMIETNIQATFEKFAVRKKVYHVLIELLQNICKHGYKEDGRREGIFLMGKDRSHYMLSAGNLIENHLIADFKRQLDLVNSLNQEELKKLFREVLMQRDPTQEGGAGLGLIDMARESSAAMEYDFLPYSENTSFFSIRLTV